MNTPNPLVPQGSKLEQKSNARSRVKLAVFFVLSIHVVGLMVLLVQGCRPEEQQPEPQPVVPDFELPPFEPITPVVVETNNEQLLPPITNPPTTNNEWADAAQILPPKTNAPVIPTTPVMQEYIIQKGDTYYSIGKAFGVTMKAIQNANPGVDPTKLQVGKTIVIPPPAPVETTPEVVPTASGEVVYTVVSGDTLSSIAKKYKTTWQAIRDLNSLPTTNIKVGQKLRIPASGGGN